MKYTLKATSIVEAMVVMLVVVVWITWMYTIFSSSQKLSDSTHNRLEALQIAREGIETVMNIRDTNALLFKADLTNCWNTLNYNTACLWNSTTTYDIPHNKSFILYQDSSNRWILTQKTYAGLDSYANVNYRNTFRVKKIGDFYTQSSTGSTDFTPLYTREIKVIYLDNNSNTGSTSNLNKMFVQSRVRWADSSSKKPYEVSLDTVLTNWQNRN